MSKEYNILILISLPFTLTETPIGGCIYITSPRRLPFISFVTRSRHYASWCSTTLTISPLLLIALRSTFTTLVIHPFCHFVADLAIHPSQSFRSSPTFNLVSIPTSSCTQRGSGLMDYQHNSPSLLCNIYTSANHFIMYSIPTGNTVCTQPICICEYQNTKLSAGSNCGIDFWLLECIHYLTLWALLMFIVC